jgi:hypothetical protein
MIARTQTARLKLRSALRHAVIAMGGVFIVAGGLLCSQIVLKNREALRIEQQNELLAKQIRTTKGEVERASRLVATTAPTDLSAVAKFQSDVERMAGARHCSVVEFRASSDVLPYLTRFAKTTNVSGWGQVTAQVSLSGSAKNVSATLVDLIDSHIPFEFDSMEITRSKTNELGEATVIGHATLRVLIRTSKEAA